ncbi:SAM-dependent methyltransferase [Roseivivax isoporae]|uniref:Cyclopropane-fatty-acyl-phospholipid synthase n=1 Tax=Roseivivax isoporae LMG 25204 TaxID=1449351 RepID=X7F444_9RHOB|nr:cyclopropane-fatty-acyl-phospholipid synthase family protein [Roseivivax isoporae]ETX27682.1 cyclopropane-fatty-acyl-phospholipid synthase [Roseivivax isoporae LMG 25204]
MWENFLDRVLRRIVVDGTLTVTMPDGTVRTYGSGHGIESSVALTDPGILRRLCLSPVLALGEGYMDGSIEVREGGLYDFVALLVRNRERHGMPGWFALGHKLRNAARRMVQRNTPLSARRNVAHHYDISDDLYRLFLDADMQYSCAYFARPDMTLEEAQEAKKAHIARKLMIEPGMRVLDIGCGWGGMALTLARDFGAHVTGVTLSSNQHRTATERAAAEGLSGQTDFRLKDYRDVTDRFDRIVSVGMLEHVGLPQFPVYFGKVHELLRDDGVALIHTIGLTSPPSPTSPWIAKYIFPGGYVPALSELARPIEAAGLWTADLEVLRGHYGPTLHHWSQRFEAQADKVEKMYDARFVRMWRFYLVACEIAFEEQRQAVFQLQLSRRQYAVPTTRDYLYRGESREEYAQAAQ